MCRCRSIASDLGSRIGGPVPNAIGLVNTELDLKQNLETIRQNEQETSKALLKIGGNLIKEKKSRVAQAITSTSYVALTEWQAGIKCSGGLVIIVFNPYVTSATSTLTVQIMIDDAEVRTGAFGSAATVEDLLTMVIFKSLTKGNHTIKINAKVSGATITVGHTAIDSALYVAEFNGA